MRVTKITEQFFSEIVILVLTCNTHTQCFCHVFENLITRQHILFLQQDTVPPNTTNHFHHKLKCWNPHSQQIETATIIDRPANT